MNKYKRMYILNEGIPNIINNFELSLLLLDFKISFTKANDFVTFKNLNNDVCLRLILNRFYKYNAKTQDYLKKKILNRINNGYLYFFYIKESCNRLLDKKFDALDDLLKSFVATGLVKEAKVIQSDKKNFIEIITNSDEKIRYSHISLKKDLIDAYKGNCHIVTSYFLKNCEKSNNAVVVLENNELFGEYYHSFLLEDGIMYDFAHNIMMGYENYLKLIKPKILVCSDSNTILNGIKELKNNKSFVDSEYVDILKYAMEKQSKI